MKWVLTAKKYGQTLYFEMYSVFPVLLYNYVIPSVSDCIFHQFVAFPGIDHLVCQMCYAPWCSSRPYILYTPKMGSTSES